MHPVLHHFYLFKNASHFYGSLPAGRNHLSSCIIIQTSTCDRLYVNIAALCHCDLCFRCHRCFLFAAQSARFHLLVIRTLSQNITNLNLDRIHQMNQLAREVCETPIEVGELERRIREIQNTKELEPWKMMLLYGANAAVFSVFFGGGPAEALFGALTGMGLCLLLGATEHIFTNEIVCYAFCSALWGLFLGLIRKYVMPYAVDPALMGNIMLLIPGIPFTNSIRDMLSGDTMSGLLRMCECLLRTVAVAAGFVGVMTLLGVAGI